LVRAAANRIVASTNRRESLPSSARANEGGKELADGIRLAVFSYAVLPREAASTYKVDTDAIALKVKQEFAAKEKSRKEPRQHLQTRSRNAKQLKSVWGSLTAPQNIAHHRPGLAPGGRTTFPFLHFLFAVCGDY
jgi:hypothetical protein